MTDRPLITRDVFDSSGRGIRHRGLRHANEKAVLTVIGFNAGVSNAEIARLSGLAPQTVSAILIDLERKGLIERGPVLRGRRGQPATPIYLDASGAFGIGIEVSWTHIDAVLIDFHANVLGQRHLDHAFPDARSVGATLIDMVQELRALLPDTAQPRLQDIGIALPGRLHENLYLLDAPQEQADLWHDLDLASLMDAATGLNVSILNDGNAACWAELIALERPRPTDVLYFLVSHYIAAGIIGDGALWEGPGNNSANLGSMLVQFDDGGPQVAHAFASVWALKQSLATGGDPNATTSSWIAQSARTLARVIFNAMTVIETPLVVIDTVLDKDITAQLTSTIQHELTQLPIRGFVPPRVVAGVHGRLAPAIGAAELPMFRRYF